MKIIVGCELNDLDDRVRRGNYQGSRAYVIVDQVDGKPGFPFQRTDDSSLFGTVGLAGFDQLTAQSGKTDGYSEIRIDEAVFVMFGNTAVSQMFQV